MIYTGYTCPVCSNKFEEKDDVVVCPVCGTPHHRACWQSLGHCINEDKHAEGFAWTPPEPEKAPEQPKTEQTRVDVLICPRCGLPNPPGEHTCARCKMPLNTENRGGFSQFDSQQNNAPFGEGVPFGAPMHSYRNPYAESAKAVFGDTEISGIPASEVAEYVQKNSDKYIASFIDSEPTEGKKKKHFNFSAAIFSVYWLFYRKMVKVGCIATLLLVAFQIIGTVGVSYAYQKFKPDAVKEYSAALNTCVELYQKIASDESTAADRQAFVKASDTLSKSEFFMATNGAGVVIYVIFGIVMGFIGNDLYKKKLVKDILRLRTIATDDATYHFILRHNGGTSALNIFFPIIIMSFIRMILQIPT